MLYPFLSSSLPLQPSTFHRFAYNATLSPTIEQFKLLWSWEYVFLPSPSSQFYTEVILVRSFHISLLFPFWCYCSASFCHLFTLKNNGPYRGAVIELYSQYFSVVSFLRPWYCWYCFPPCPGLQIIPQLSRSSVVPRLLDKLIVNYITFSS